MAAHVSWAKTENAAARTAPARKALLDRFERQVDPEGTLDPAERARRANHARRAHTCSVWRSNRQKRVDGSGCNPEAEGTAAAAALADEKHAAHRAAPFRALAEHSYFRLSDRKGSTWRILRRNLGSSNTFEGSSR